MKHIITLFLIVLSPLIKLNSQSIESFNLNKDILSLISNYEINKETNSIETDTSIVRVESFYSFNTIIVYNELKQEDKSYITKLYFDTKNIETHGVIKNGQDIGTWKFYSNSGSLEQIRNYDKGIWIVNDINSFPHYELRQRIKELCDKKLKEKYGDDFFQNYVIWNFMGSGIRNSTEFGRWTDKFENPPNRFEVRYMIKPNTAVDENEMVFSVDSLGQEIPRFFMK